MRRIDRLVGWQAFEEGCIPTLGKSHFGKGGENEVLHKTLDTGDCASLGPIFITFCFNLCNTNELWRVNQFLI